MTRILLVLLVVSSLPTSVMAAHSGTPASYLVAQSVVAGNPSPGNTYALGASVVLTAPVGGDLEALGGSVITAAPVLGDDLIVGGSVSSRGSVAGDLRAIAGSVEVAEPVAGDLVAAGLSIRDSGRAGASVFLVGANITMTSGAEGPVTIYGNNVALGGDFGGDVTVTAGGRVALSPGTHIRGKFNYQAPDVASIPTSAVVEGGVTYTNASYLPDVGTSRALAFLSIGFFLVVRVIGAFILAGLIAGLFPGLARTVTERVLSMRLRNMLLLFLLGFGICVATPIVIGLLLLTFVGIGLALLLGILYALLFLLAFLYAGIVFGNLLARRFRGRDVVLWHDGVVGMAALSLVTLIPYIGFPIVGILTLFAAGTLLQLFFRFAFPHDASGPDF
jgi:hypothetical protein